MMQTFTFVPVNELWKAFVADFHCPQINVNSKRLAHFLLTNSRNKEGWSENDLDPGRFENLENFQ